jgi:hypothetical protein
LSSTLTTVTQVRVSKKPRFGPKVASQAWWIDRIRDKEGPKYLTYWTHFTDYQIGQFKTLAEYDYFVLGEGIETEGAPDFGASTRTCTSTGPSKTADTSHILREVL